MRFSFRHVPYERRKQTTAVALLVFFALFCLTFWFCCVINPALWVFYIPYILFCKFIYRPHHNGGAQILALKNLSFWRNFCNYFPSSIKFQKNWHRNCDDKDKYIFAIHPHGVVSLSVWANILSNGSGLYDKLPKLSLRVVTLPVNFYIPFWREFLLVMGMIDSHESTIVTAIEHGSSVGIVIGGASEALDAIPQKDYYLTVKNRRGFIRIAMQHGCSIVPVFNFGENDLFDQTSNHRIRHIQKLVKKYVGFTTPLFRGRGVFNYDFGLMPHRQPITTVIGKPIQVKQIENPTKEDLDKVHKLYLDALKELYYSYREECGSEDRDLIFV